MGNIDLVGDMISRMKNSILIKSRTVLVLRTNLIINIAKILKEEGFIESYEECGEFYMSDKGFIYKYVSLTLKYKGVKQKSYITGLKRVSKPGFRVYVNSKNIPKVLGGLGVAVLSTSKGIIVDRVARSEKTGGEVLFIIW